MGHRLSKTTHTGPHVPANKTHQKRCSIKTQSEAAVDISDPSTQSTLITSPSIVLNPEHLASSSNSGPTINVITDADTFRLETRTDSSSSSTVGPRQYIIKIQFAKMEPGENNSTTAMPSTSSLDDNAGSNNNLNVERSNMTVNAISFRRNIVCDSGNEIKLNNLNVATSVVVNNNFISNFSVVPYIEEDDDNTENRRNVQNFNIMVQQVGNCQIVDNAEDNRQNCNNNGTESNRNSTSSSEFSDFCPEISEPECSTRATTRTCEEENKNHCCRRKKSSSSPASTSLPSSSYTSKWRCCKCTCRDALKKLRPNCTKKTNELSPTTSNSRAELQSLASALPSSHELPRTHGSHLAIWSPANDVIIPLASPQIVVVQYPPTSAASHLVTLGPIPNLEEHSIRLLAGDLTVPTTPESSNSMTNFPCSTTTPNGTVVHSQVDYIHRLVPDLERITKSSFYWGKMDRYEAERLLEGKPEGTFLLRDSAQEEYLFSVTFRKYGRSLHARIEQFNRKFSFDCHDPGVFTASTVTGLLEHYKDPSCVMFFEPMLTIPLHRNRTFSLQQLCRATIVSRTTYDGINEMEIPVRLKSYLKEYHYKQRVRVKPFDEPFYTCT